MYKNWFDVKIFIKVYLLQDGEAAGNKD